MVLNGVTVSSDPSYTTASGLITTYGGLFMVIGCTFGTSTHTTTDISCLGALVKCINTSLNSTTQVTLSVNNGSGAQVRAHRLGGTTADKTWTPYGTIIAQSTTRHSAQGLAWQLVPSQASYSIIFPGPTVYDGFKIPVSASVAVRVSCWVYYDASYNGNMPTLNILGGILQGISSTVTATAATGQSGTWQQLTVTATPSEQGTMVVYVTANGTAGNAYVDDFLVEPRPLSTFSLDNVDIGLPNDTLIAPSGFVLADT